MISSINTGNHGNINILSDGQQISPGTTLIISMKSQMQCQPLTLKNGKKLNAAIVPY